MGALLWSKRFGYGSFDFLLQKCLLGTLGGKDVALFSVCRSFSCENLLERVEALVPQIGQLHGSLGVWFLAPYHLVIRCAILRHQVSIDCIRHENTQILHN